jgi:hypothetical protein
MRRIHEVLRLKFELRFNDAQVARGAGIARATVQDDLRRIRATGLSFEQLMGLDDEALDQRLFRRNTAPSLPDWEAIEREGRHVDELGDVSVSARVETVVRGRPPPSSHRRVRRSRRSTRP